MSDWYTINLQGVKKKVQKAATRKKCQILYKWVNGISNHLYFSAQSGGGDGKLTRAIWDSILNHVTDIHLGHGPLYPQCQHGDLSDEPREWIIHGISN